MRHSERGSFDRETVNAILDAALLCHVGYVLDGAPLVTPTLFWRDGERVFWHGSAASRALRTQAECKVCLTVSLLDGIVLSRSAFNHSVNYRSVMLFGTARSVDDSGEKLLALEKFMERIARGRWGEVRQPTESELKATSVLWMISGKAQPRFVLSPSVTNRQIGTSRSGPGWSRSLPASASRSRQRGWQAISRCQATCRKSGYHRAAG